ncbi:response regulator [Ilumatobacter sp.]|uniref:response regulator n=1 Tax=Ilumatobacter sp. TaxID=1967498 RepID=UPI003B519C08
MEPGAHTPTVTPTVTPTDVAPVAASMHHDTSPPADRDATGRRLEHVVVVDEHSLIARGLGAALAERGWRTSTTTGPSADDVIALVRRARPQCVLMDVRLGDDIGRGIDLIGPLSATGAHVVVFTAERRSLVLAECLEAGAAGWLPRSSDLDEVDAALRDVIGGGTIVGTTERTALLASLSRERHRARSAQVMFDELTGREALVLAALVDGLSAEEIARERYVALTTVRSQIRAVLRKLEVRSQLAAVAVASAHRHLLPERCADRDRRRLHAPPERAPSSVVADAAIA